VAIRINRENTRTNLRKNEFPICLSRRRANALGAHLNFLQPRDDTLPPAYEERIPFPGSTRALPCSGWRLANRTNEDAIGEGADGYSRGRVCSPDKNALPTWKVPPFSEVSGRVVLQECEKLGCTHVFNQRPLCLGPRVVCCWPNGVVTCLARGFFRPRANQSN